MCVTGVVSIMSLTGKSWIADFNAAAEKFSSLLLQQDLSLSEQFQQAQGHSPDQEETYLAYEIQNRTSGTDNRSHMALSTGTRQVKDIIEEQKRKTQQAYRDILFLNRMLEMIEAQIAAHKEEMSKLVLEIQILNKLEGLVRSGKYDATNEEHREMMERVNLNPDKDEDTILQGINDGRGTRTDRHKELERKIDELKEEREKILDTLELEAGQRSEIVQEYEEKVGEGISANKAMRSILEDKSSEKNQAESDKGLEKGVSVKLFELLLKEQQEIEDPIKRLASEKTIFDELSKNPDAHQQMKESDEWKHLFEEGYFDALENPEPQMEEPHKVASLSPSISKM